MHKTSRHRSNSCPSCKMIITKILGQRTGFVAFQDNGFGRQLDRGAHALVGPLRRSAEENEAQSAPITIHPIPKIGVAPSLFVLFCRCRPPPSLSSIVLVLCYASGIPRPRDYLETFQPLYDLILCELF